MFDVIEYTDDRDRSPFAAWFEDLDAVSAAKITVALARLAAGNTSNIKSVGEWVMEQKVDFGPGYRVYFAWEGKRLIVLLGGGSKQRQQRDIANAIERWRDYKARKVGR
jgi:putative addiction module killer protein